MGYRTSATFEKYLERDINASPRNPKPNETFAQPPSPFDPLHPLFPMRLRLDAGPILISQGRFVSHLCVHQATRSTLSNCVYRICTLIEAASGQIAMITAAYVLRTKLYMGESPLSVCTKIHTPLLERDGEEVVCPVSPGTIFL